MICCASVRVVCIVLVSMMQWVCLFVVVLGRCGSGMLVSRRMFLSVNVVIDLLEEVQGFLEIFVWESIGFKVVAVDLDHMAQ